MLVVRLDSILEDIIRYETETSGLEVARPVLERLDTIERKVDTDLYKLYEDDGNDDKQVMKRKRASATIQNICLQAVQTSPRPSEADIINRCKVDAILSVRSDDPFERFIQQAIDTTMHERTRPILEMLDMLEMKVDEYGRNAVMNGIACPVPKSITRDPSLSDSESDRENEVKNTEKELNEVIKTDRKYTRSVSTDSITFKRSPSTESLFGRKMLVRVTCWRYNTKSHEDPTKIYLDLTKKRVDILVERTDLE